MATSVKVNLKNWCDHSHGDVSIKDYNVYAYF